MSKVSILQTRLRALSHEELSRVAAEMAIGLARVRIACHSDSLASDMDASEVAQAALLNTMIEAIQELADS